MAVLSIIYEGQYGCFVSYGLLGLYIAMATTLCLFHYNDKSIYNVAKILNITNYISGQVTKTFDKFMK